MSQTNILLRCYYEVLHDLIVERKNELINQIRKTLNEAVKTSGFQKLTRDAYDAYWEACLAFIEERIETYNPIGVQYTYSRERREEAFHLEMQLDWYDSRDEYKKLIEAAYKKAEFMTSDEIMEEKAKELIREAGAFPNKSIITGYTAKPALNKLPDYVVAMIIEECIGKGI